MNRLDRVIASMSPGWAARRARARYSLQVFDAAYDATEPGRRRSKSRDYGSADAITRGSTHSLRTQARALERNHDIAAGALGTLVQNVVGAHGIGIEPQPRMADGSIDRELARELTDLYRDWCKRPEVTREHDWASTQRLLARSWLRDGEVLNQYLSGRVPFLEHAGAVPLSLEMIEADLLPLWLDDPAQNIVQGVERNTWGRVRNYHMLKEHPGDAQYIRMAGERKIVAAQNMAHLKLVQRINQARGVSVFASVLTRLEDIKDYEESERIAAKVAASMAAMIKKGNPDFYEPEPGGSEARHMTFKPGMIFDDLRPGESVETIDSNRPNTNLEDFRSGQLRAAAGGIGVSYSSLSKNYDGTYSAQRQELVEQYGAYAMLGTEFVSQIIRPTWQRFVKQAAASGLINRRRVIDRALDDALYVLPAMPWIDPKKETEAWVLGERAGYISGPEIIRKRGASPQDVLDQEAQWREDASGRGLNLTTDPKKPGDTNAKASQNWRR